MYYIIDNIKYNYLFLLNICGAGIPAGIQQIPCLPHILAGQIIILRHYPIPHRVVLDAQNWIHNFTQNDMAI